VSSNIELLESRLGADWSGIRAARARTDSILGQLETAVAGLDDPNYSVIVTGSLGRGEATEASDADWLLLADGRADPEHANLSSSILLACFSGDLFAPSDLYDVENDDEYFSRLAELIRAQTDVSPLELLARAVLQSENDSVADAIFSSYDHFLKVLSDPDARKKLEAVHFDDALDDPTYADLRDASHQFREGVTRLFFDTHLNCHS